MTNTGAWLSGITAAEDIVHTFTPSSRFSKSSRNENDNENENQSYLPGARTGVWCEA